MAPIFNAENHCPLPFSMFLSKNELALFKENSNVVVYNKKEVIFQAKYAYLSYHVREIRSGEDLQRRPEQSLYYS